MTPPCSVCDVQCAKPELVGEVQTLDLKKIKSRWRSVFGAMRRLYKNPNDLEAAFIHFQLVILSLCPQTI